MNISAAHIQGKVLTKPKLVRSFARQLLKKKPKKSDIA
jgi:hypothetical protein